ncbi:MAG: DUF507 family protein [Proteobacteria bacterium]|nr:DUF507 family protein [Pseudomonadota bacterium]MCP4915470.1 DUF507 family protein [Pseudomonadota bacterium]
MRLYRTRIPAIAKAVVEALSDNDDIEVLPENKGEAEKDLVSIMEEYLRRDYQLRDSVKETMAAGGISYDKYGKVRSRMADEWNHPTGDGVAKYLARQFIENFMISNFVEEVYAEDGVLWRRTLDLILAHDVDENALRDEARAAIKNIAEGTVDYEIALQRSLRDVKKRKGLI